MIRTLLIALMALGMSLTVGSCATGGESSTGLTTHATTKAQRASRAEDLFTLFDADGDGFITRAELERGLRSASNVEPNPNLMMAMSDAPVSANRSPPNPVMSAVGSSARISAASALA